MKILSFVSQLIIPLFILFAVVYGYYRKVRVYDSFVCGAKDGLNIIVKIFPYILAIFVGIKSFQASGAFDFIKTIFAQTLQKYGVSPEIASIALIKPLSGSASLGIFTDIVKSTGPDSITSLTAAVIVGSAETTFYVLAVYLGAAAITKTKYLIPVCVIADIIGIIVAISVVRLIF